jgi:hypothetical protein
MIEEIVCTPMFLPSTTELLIHDATMKVARDGQAETGDQIEVKPIGITHDPDGWPMARWRVRIYKGR